MTGVETESPAIALENVSFAWPGEDGFRLTIPRWTVARGARVALIGPSGSGKTTLLNLLAGVTRADRGAVRVLGSDLSLLSGARRDQFRGDHVGLIFQMFNLLPYASMVENALLPLRFSRLRRDRVGGDETQEARRLLSRLGLDLSTLEGRSVAQLSVGQQQRVAAARALIGAPELIVADEPTSALDPEARDGFLSLLFAEAERSGATLLCVTHDAAVAARFDRSAPLSDIVAADGGASSGEAAA